MLAIFALRLTGPWFPEEKLIFLSPRCKRGSLQRTGASSPGVWQFGLGPARCSSSGGTRKRAKARCQIRNR